MYRDTEASLGNFRFKGRIIQNRKVIRHGVQNADIKDDLPVYEMSAWRANMIGLTGVSIEMAQLIPHIHEIMPEPFDITNHAGNFWPGAAIAIGAGLIYSLKENGVNFPPKLSAEYMSKFRKFGIPAACATTALVNCITETKWGISHLPVARALDGTVPDILDIIYSSAWSGLASAAVWRRIKK